MTESLLPANVPVTLQVGEASLELAVSLPGCSTEELLRDLPAAVPHNGNCSSLVLRWWSLPDC